LALLWILFCLTPDDFTRQWDPFGQERVNQTKGNPQSA